MVTKKGREGCTNEMKVGTNSLEKKQNMLLYYLVTVSMKRMGRNEKEKKLRAVDEGGGDEKETTGATMIRF
jgi:hypothetical protein